MLPLLRHVAAQGSCTLREATEAMANHYKLSDDERHELLPSGKQSTFANRVGWAKTYLVKSGSLRAQKRATVEVTERGQQILANPPAQITIGYLAKFKEFREFRSLIKGSEGTEEEVVVSEAVGTAKGLPGATIHNAAPAGQETSTPDEQLDSAYQRLRGALADELLETILAGSPSFFEQLVIDLLVRMGYGGTRQDAAKLLGRSHDGGIDGIIKEDRLGLDIIYIQAKKWAKSHSVGRPEIQQFVGALQGHNARKGVFFTTSSFCKSAREYVDKIGSNLALIDGVTLAQFMIDYGLGVTTIKSYEVKRIDSDYFVE